jgi:amidohydrolase
MYVRAVAIHPRLSAFHDDMTAWRRDLHAHPELAFEEHRTADFVAATLGEIGVEVHRGLARTGVVGTLRGKHPGTRAIGLRADMDALPIDEQNELPYRSQNRGVMHACGHDGHTAMLLGAARYLAETRDFAGTVYFIFQPAEEVAGGGRVMVEDGLFEKFPMDAVFGLHNMPGMAVGSVGMRAGPAMAALDTFEITVKGKGAHAAAPHLGIDPVVIASHIVTGLQSLVSRRTSPLDTAVVTVTQIHAGSTWNAIPQTAVLRGTVRTLQPAVRGRVERELEQIARGLCSAYGADMELDYRQGYPALINTEAETALCARVAASVVGADSVNTSAGPETASEDFAYMLEEKPGCYIWLGNGVEGQGGCSAHNPGYDFNDEISIIGASYWVALVETALAG